MVFTLSLHFRRNLNDQSRAISIIQVLRGRAPRIKFKTIKHDTTDDHKKSDTAWLKLPARPPLIMKLGSYFMISAGAAGINVLHAWSVHEQFYPAVIHLSSDKLSLALLYNFVFATFLLFGYATLKFFIGTNRIAFILIVLRFINKFVKRLKR